MRTYNIKFLCNDCVRVSADVASSECRLNEMKPSPYAMIAQMEKQPVSGCISTGKKNVLDR